MAVLNAPKMTDENFENLLEFNELVRKVALARLPTEKRDDATRTKFLFYKTIQDAIQDWCAKHQQQIAACYLTPRRELIKVAVVSKHPEYDNELGNAVASLEQTLFDKGCWAETILLPPLSLEELSPFASAQESVRIDANP